MKICAPLKQNRSRILNVGDSAGSTLSGSSSGAFSGSLLWRFGRWAFAAGFASIALVASECMIPPANRATADIRASFRFDGAARQCAELINPCLSLPTAQRAGCIFEAALDSQCEGTELGGLAFRRWANEANSDSDADSNDPFTVQNDTLSRSCIDQFDKLLAERLQSKQVTSSEIIQLTVTLEGCRIVPQHPELLRP